jgi:hypothetical protein
VDYCEDGDEILGSMTERIFLSAILGRYWVVEFVMVNLF